MDLVPHQMILASAGSGKTTRLSHRIIRLLALGVEPSRIMALTFTRKAAGEFLNAVLSQLADAASDQLRCRWLAEQIGMPEFSQKDFRSLLHRLVRQLGRLKLTTLDSFFLTVIRAFPFELGLAGSPDLLDSFAESELIEDVFGQLFHSLEPAARTDFLVAFKLATFGSSEKRLLRRLQSFMDSYRSLLMQAPAVEIWANPPLIWEQGCEWLRDPAIDLQTILRSVQSGLPAMKDGSRQWWDAFLQCALDWEPGQPFAQPMERIMERLLDRLDLLGVESFEITCNRGKVTIDPAFGTTLRVLMHHWLNVEYKRKIITTRGIHQIITSFEKCYNRHVRLAGQITFGDLPLLLLGQHRQWDEGREIFSLTQDSSPDERRLRINYRLDAQVDHWLLDEFQDTSRLQWAVIRDLLDEVMQDVSGRRSVFIVGDVKQAIYGWRGGDSGLFREIQQQYSDNPARPLTTQHMVKTYRCRPAIVDAVNDVFGQREILAELFPAAAVDRWQSEFRLHESAVTLESGYVELALAENETTKRQLIVQRLLDVQPWLRGISSAVLVLSNKDAATWVDLLREAGIPCAREGEVEPASDNQVGLLFMALLQAAWHPLDTFSWEYLEMSPLRNHTEFSGSSREQFSRSVVHRLSKNGFAGVLREWFVDLQLDAFHRHRLRQLQRLCSRFDEGGERDVDVFLRYLAAARLPEAGAGQVVQVMTIHKSKGLGFDMVFLPELEGTKLASVRGDVCIQRSHTGDIRWILGMLPQAIAKQDPALETVRVSMESSECFEQMCLLYVAMTRAKRGLYLAIEGVPEKVSKSANFPSWLRTALDFNPHLITEDPGSRIWITFSAGEQHWFTAAPVRLPQTVDCSSIVEIQSARTTDDQSLFPHEPQNPSAEDLITDLAVSFTPARFKAAGLGSKVHELLARIEWLPDGAFNLEALFPILPTQDTDSRALLAAALSSPAIQTLLQQPLDSRKVEVWREQPFDVVLDNRWVSGVFDRVVLVANDQGGWSAATIVDYKTDHYYVWDPVHFRQRHSGQMLAYRRCLALLTGIEETEITLLLVALRAGQVVTVPNPGVS